MLNPINYQISEKLHYYKEYRWQVLLSINSSKGSGYTLTSIMSILLASLKLGNKSSRVDKDRPIRLYLKIMKLKHSNKKYNKLIWTSKGPNKYLISKCVKLMKWYIDKYLDFWGNILSRDGQKKTRRVAKTERGRIMESLQTCRGSKSH